MQAPGCARRPAAIDLTVKGASGGVLLKGGYEVIEVLRTGRLVAAAGREPGMGWARRIDCVGVA